MVSRIFAGLAGGTRTYRQLIQKATDTMTRYVAATPSHRLPPEASMSTEIRAALSRAGCGTLSECRIGPGIIDTIYRSALINEGKIPPVSVPGP